ncbi:MAG: PilC/PilY family type IV pilus protein [Myxococcales bacterium]|nr:PilC/PilY family type IV pilus protein [Myxococcales bacterium]
MNVSRFLIAAVLFSAAFASADPPKPRVMVILDTSRSMLEPTNSDLTVTQMSEAGGDWDTNTNPVCANKFCTAKKVVDTVIPQFTADARIGLTTYYQFLLTAQKADNQQTQCIYDVLAPAGQLRRFTSPIDLTGSGNTVCPTTGPVGGANDATCVGAVRRLNFPDRGGSGTGAGMDGICKSGGVTNTYAPPATLPNAMPPPCAGVGCYLLTKTLATPAMPVICSLYNDSTITPPQTYSTPTCSTNGVYSSIAAKTVIRPGAAAIRKYQAAGATMCSGAAALVPVPGGVLATNYAPAGAAESLNANPTIGLAAGNWDNFGPLWGKCSGVAPCALYRSSDPISSTTGRAWYGFFNPVTAPVINSVSLPGSAVTSPAWTVPSSYAFSTSVGPGSGYQPIIAGLTGTRSIPTATACFATNRYGGGQTLGGTFGIAGARATAATNMSTALGGRADETPTTSGAETNCTGAWPCDVTLVSDVADIVGWSPSTTLYNPGLLMPPNQRFRAPATAVTPTSSPTYRLRIIDPALMACPAIGTTSANPVLALPSIAWTSGTPGGCNVNGPCTFSAPVVGMPATASGGHCNSPLSRFNSATPDAASGSSIIAGGICSFNGKTYTSTTFVNDAMSNPYRATKNIPATDMCTTGTFSVNDMSGYINSNISASAAPNHAMLTYLSESAGPPQSSDTMPPRVNALIPEPGYMNPPATDLPRGGSTQLPNPLIGAPSDPSGGCLGPVGTSVQSNNNTLCAGTTPCTLTVLGPVQVSSICGLSERNKPCFVCQYQPRQYTWQRPTKNCLYSSTRTEWTVDRTAQTCEYTRPQWETEVQDPTTHTCTYRVGAARYDFNQPNVTWCEYFAIRTDFESPRTLYTYEYLTKGNEPIGRAVSANTAGNLCTSPWVAGNSFETACPETVAGCGGLTSLTMAATPHLGSSTCRLKVGGSTSNLSSGMAHPDLGPYALRLMGQNDGRFSNFTSGSRPFGGALGAAVDPSHRSCEAALPPADPDTYKSESVAPLGFCAKKGAGPITERKLISDYYADAPFVDVNGATMTNVNTMGATYAAAYPAISGWTVTTTNTPYKAQGFSANIDAGATLGTGDMSARTLFVPIPNDATYVPADQRAAIRRAMRACVPPSVSAPGPDGMLDGGACVADERVREPAPCVDNNITGRNCGPTGDFTPLYGSLRNTYDYLDERWRLDETDQQCREYFIVLATDGLENTPKGYTVGGVSPATSVQGLVGSFRNNVPMKTRPDVKTFVIALGTGAAGEPALNAVANAGGTTQAFNATNLAELEAALQAVFTVITQGVFSRSRPAIGSDGARLYAAQFVRPNDAGVSTGPDQFGLLTAYKVNPTDGTFSIAWEHGGKLNHASHPARNIVVGLRDNDSPYDKMLVPFSAGNAELVDQLDDNPNFGAAADAGVTPANVISFLTNKGEAYTGVGIRSSKLGPISHSAPVVVGKSPFDSDYGGLTAGEKSGFATFRTFTDTRPTRVLVEAADGMLHSVIEADTAPTCTVPGEADPSCPSGREGWSFIPGSLYLGSNGEYESLVQSLFKLKQGGWGALYLNNTASVVDVCGNGVDRLAINCASGDWRTIAIISQREGGRGLAAVDVTNPALAPNLSRFLWDFWDGDLGFTFSAPAVGRVSNDDGDDEFIAIFGGGFDDPGTTGGGEFEGRSVFIVNALTGNLIKKFRKFDRGSSVDIDLMTEVVARPAIHRRPGANFTYLSSAFVSAGETLFALRFADTAGVQKADDGKWKPDEVFDPTSARNTDRATCGTPPCSVVQVRSVFEQTPGDPLAMPTPIPPVYALQNASVGTSPGGVLPLLNAPPIFNRPRIAPLLVPSGAQADLLVGTGDVRDPNQPNLALFRTNYFYAIHDFNQQLSGPNNDGRALWINQFPEVGVNRPEQVVSEPAVITGCVVVATYTLPLAGAGCNREGDTTLYGFDPLSGDLKKCLVYSAPSPYAGQTTSVLKMPGVGIPSDLVVINDNIYLSTSRDGLMKAPVSVPPRPGAVRSYRRIK